MPLRCDPCCCRWDRCSSFWTECPRHLLGFRLERHLDDRVLAAGPRHIVLDVRGGVGKKKRQSDSVTQRRLSKVVRTIQDVQAWPELNIGLTDRPEIGDAEPADLHRPFPD